MPQDQTASRHIARWLDELSLLVRHGASDDQVKLYVDMFARETIPTGAFTAESLHEVASASPHWPDFATLRGHLVNWWNSNRPLLSSPATGGNTKLGTMDTLWLNYYHTRCREGADRAILRSLMRKMSPAAWNVISPDERRARQRGGNGDVDGNSTGVVSVAETGRLPATPSADLFCEAELATDPGDEPVF